MNDEQKVKTLSRISYLDGLIEHLEAETKGTGALRFQKNKGKLEMMKNERDWIKATFAEVFPQQEKKPTSIKNMNRRRE